MPRKRKVGRPRKYKKTYGRGLNDIFKSTDEFNKRARNPKPISAPIKKKNLFEEVTKAHQLIRDKRLISRGANLLNDVIPRKSIKEFADFADRLGYGKRRKYRVKRRM